MLRKFQNSGTAVAKAVHPKRIAVLLVAVASTITALLLAPSHAQAAATLESTLQTPEFQFRAVHSNKCLNVSGGGPEDLAPVIQFRCVNAPNERWRMIR